VFDMCDFYTDKYSDRPIKPTKQVFFVVLAFAVLVYTFVLYITGIDGGIDGGEARLPVVLRPRLRDGDLKED
jgi:hypothetical protein